MHRPHPSRASLSVLLAVLLVCAQMAASTLGVDCSTMRRSRCPAAAVMHCTHCDGHSVAAAPAAEQDQQATEASPVKFALAVLPETRIAAAPTPSQSFNARTQRASATDTSPGQHRPLRV